MKMTKSIKYVVVSALCALFCAVVGLAFSFTSIFTAKADVIVADNITCKGASIRLSEDGKSGIRFRVRINVTEKEDGDVVIFDNVEYNFADIDKGILVIPTRYIENQELSLDGVSKGYQYNDKKVYAANPDDLVWSKGSEINDNGETIYYYESSAYVYNIPEKHYENDFSWRGYCTAGGVTYYSDVDTRSVSTVAILEKYEDDNKTERTYVEGDPLTEILNGFLPMRTTVTSNFVNRAAYLYRVGNQNEIKVSSLFEISAFSDIALYATDVTMECVAGDAEMTFDGESQTVKFSGTGVATLTLTERYSRGTTELTVEVVDATNVTDYKDLKNESSVLLKNITMSSGSSYYLSNATLYGNGFTFDVTAGKDHNTTDGSISGNGTVIITNSTLDNISVIGEVYTEYGGTVKSEYNFPTVLALGNSVIANSYISNGASAVRVGSGCDLEIVNTTLEGGIFANLDIRGGTITLDNVVTINQSNTDGSSISNDKGSVGLGVVIYAGSTVQIDIKNNFTQYNCISENATFPSGDANTLKNVIFGNGYTQFQFEYDGATWVNTGIISMVAEVKGDNISALDGYIGSNASIASYDGYVYAPVPNTVTSPKEYISNGQYAIVPSVAIDYTTKNNVPQVSGSNDYCYYDEATGIYLISFDDGESHNWNFDILTVSKGETVLSYDVSVTEGATINSNDKTITFDAAGDYTITYAYSDSNNYRLNTENGIIELYTKEYTKTVRVTVYEVVDTSAKTEFAFGGNGYRTETANNLTYVMPDVNATVDSNTAGIGKTTIGEVDIYYPIVSMHKSGSSSWYNYFSVFEAVTITDLDGTVYNTSTTELPSGLTVIGGFILDADGNVSTAESANGTSIFNYSTGKEIKCAEYSPYGLCYYPDSQFTKSTNSRDEQTIVAKYRYTDSNGTPYYYYVGYWCEKHTKSNTCVTPDTLVTLADGTQKEIQYVTYEDELLVWDFVNGEYAVMPSSIVMNHGYGTYTVVLLTFDDGTVVNTINGHGFFDKTTNEFVILNEENVANYVGHDFVKQDVDKTTRLISYSISEQYTESWSILTAEHYNCMLEGMLTITPAEVDGSPKYLMPFELGEDMRYDVEKMQADIEKYGLYTYEDFVEYMTYEQFAALNLSIFKVSVGKGYITWEEILYLISIHIKN